MTKTAPRDPVVAKTLVVLPAILLMLLLGGCSDDAGDVSGDESGSTSLEAPIIVDDAADVTANTGEFIVVSTPNASRVETDDPAVLEVSQAYSDGSAEFNAGAEAVAAGNATLGVYDDEELLYEVRVTVEG